MCGLHIMNSVCFSLHMWVHVYCLDERESCWFSEMLVIIIPAVFLHVTCFTGEHQKCLPIALASHIPSVYRRLHSLSSFLKGFPCAFISYFTLSSCHSHSQLLPLNMCMHCFLVAYYNSDTFPLSFSASCSCSSFICPLLSFLQPSFTLC